MDTTIIIIIFLIIVVIMFLTSRNEKDSKNRMFNTLSVCTITFFLGLFIGIGHNDNKIKRTYIKPNKIQLTYKVFYNDSIYLDSINIFNNNKGEYIN